MWLLLAAFAQHTVWFEAALVPLGYLGRSLLALSLLALSSLLGAYLALPHANTHRSAADAALSARAALGRTVASFGFAGLSLPLIYGALLQRVQGWLEPLFAALLVGLFSLVLVAFLYTLGQNLAYALTDRYPHRVRQVIKPVVSLWQTLCRPLAAVVDRSSDLLLGAVGLRRQQPLSTIEQVRRLLAYYVRDHDELTLLSNVLDFGEITARDAMVPRADVTWVDLTTSLDDALEELHDSGHSRVPLCDNSPDQVIGYLHAKDLAFIQDAYLPGKVDLRSLARPVIFVPESAKAMLLLHRFQEERSHLAIVVDEFGGMAGIITLEDLLEELVGEIRDEYDVEESEVQTLETGELIVDGRLRLGELEETLGISFGDAEEETIGGYIFGRLERGPQAGDVTMVDTTTFCVEAVEGLRITQVRVVPKRPVVTLEPFTVTPDQLQTEFVSDTAN